MQPRSWIALLFIMLISTSLSWGLDSEEEAFLDEINDYRASYGLGTLSLSPTLTVAAEGHSQDMADNNYFSHTSLDGRSPVDRMNDAGYDYPTTYGENIAAGYTTASAVFEGWRNSPSHNQTMLYPSFVVIGIGRHYNPSSTYGWYWTTDFGGYDDSGSPDPPPPSPPSVQIASLTHPNQGQWYPCDDALLQWTVDQDADGFSYILDGSSSTIPDEVIDTTSSQTSITDIEDGTWYFHLKAKGEGGWGETEHFALRIDTAAPGAPSISSPSHPDQQLEYQDPDLDLEWTCPGDLSGVTGYSYELDRNPSTIPDVSSDSTDAETHYQGLDEGTWYFHVRAVDRASNWGPAGHFTVNLRYPPSSDFSASPVLGPEPLMVEFESLADSSSGIVAWLWDFGDGQESAEANPTHYYEQPGQYSVNLTVWETDGDSGSELKEGLISVLPVQPNETLADQAAGSWEPVIGIDTKAYLPDRDSYVDPSAPGDTHGHDPEMVADSSGAMAYLNFEFDTPLEGGIHRAALALRIVDPVESDATVSLSYFTDTDWDELGLNWQNRPQPMTHPAGSFKINATTQGYVFLELAGVWATEASSLTLVLSVDSTSGSISLSTRETSQRPILVIGHSDSPVYRLEASSIDDTGLFDNYGKIATAGSSLTLPADVSIVAGSYSLEYLPGHRFLQWLHEGGITVAEAESRVTMITVSGNGSLTARGELTNLTYAYDDGSWEYDFGRDAGGKIAVSFSPLFRCSITGVSVYLTRVSPSAEDSIMLNIEDTNGTTIYDPICHDPESAGWNLIPFDGQVTVDGDFLACLEFLNDRQPGVGIDQNSEGTSFTFEEGEWQPYPMGFMLRARVENERPLSRITGLSVSIQNQAPRVGDEVLFRGKLSPPMAVELSATSTSPGGQVSNLTTCTNLSGDFSLHFNPLSAGRWSFTFRFEGDGQNAPATCRSEIRVLKGSVRIAAQAPYSSHYGETISINASSDPIPVPLVLETLNGEEWKHLCGMDPSGNGTFRWEYTPEHAGQYSFRVVWPGDENLYGQVSREMQHTVFPINSEITLVAGKEELAYGSAVELQGSIKPNLSEPIQIDLWVDSNWSTVSEVLSSGDGSYRYVWTPTSTGMSLVRSRWDGNPDIRGSSSEVLLIDVLKAPSNLSCQVEPAEPDLRETISIAGQIEPPSIGEVQVELTHPNGTRRMIRSPANLTGFFRSVLTPGSAGTWRIVASWKGNGNYRGCSSPEIVLKVGSQMACVSGPGVLFILTLALLKADDKHHS